MICDMKRLSGIVFMIVLTLHVFAEAYVPTHDEVKKFYKTKTMIVLERNPLTEYNVIIKEVIPAEWHITDYEFITYKEFEETYRFNSEYSFLVITNVSFEGDATGCEYRFLHALLGGPSQTISDMPSLCSVPIAYNDVDEGSYMYKVRTLLRFIQNHIELINKNPEIISKNIFEHYNENIKDIKSKTLYLVKEDLEPEINTIAKIKKVYPYKFEIKTREEIEQLIIDKDPNAVFLHKVGPEGTHLKARCYKILVGASDASFYYFDWHMINVKSKPDGFLMSDLKKLVKANE